MTYKQPELQLPDALHPCSDQRILKQFDQPVSTDWRPADRSSSTQNSRKVNSSESTGWLISSGVRSVHAADGAVLLDIKHARYYSVNEAAACVWVTIDAGPAGIMFDSIVDVLETHFLHTREELEHAARTCLAELRLAGLVRKKVVGGSESYLDRMSTSSRDRAHIHEFMHKGGRTTIASRRFVQRLRTFQALADRLFPQGADRNMDWRAKKLKDSIDNAPGKINENLGHICSELELSLSDRQARRLFKESIGIPMKDYTRKRRLVFAAAQLQNTNEQLKVIATNAGYHTYQGFRKAFYEMFCLNPVEFRRFWHRRCTAA